MVENKILFWCIAALLLIFTIGCDDSIDDGAVITGPPGDSGEKYSPVVLSHQGRNYLVPGQTLESQGFEFVLGAQREDLEPVSGVRVFFPDGETYRDLLPSTELGVPLDFFYYYGTVEGFPPAGDYSFVVTMMDSTVLEVINTFSGKVLSLPENVTADIDRDAATIRVCWDPVDEVRNYTVDLQDIQEDRSYLFVEGAGCPDDEEEDPGHWTETCCNFSDLNNYLVEGKEYGIQIAVWSDFSYGGIDGAVMFTW